MNSETRFTFGHLPRAKVNYLEKKETKEWLTKWSMLDGIKVQAFYFDRKFKIYLLDDFIRDFFGSIQVTGSLLRLASNLQFVPIGVQAESVKFQTVRSTLTTTEIFDRLTGQESNIARSTGSIIKCLPDYFQPEQDIHDSGYPIEIGDQLRKMLLRDYNKSTADIDDWLEPDDLFTSEEKDEFLFRLFSHFAIGGSLCQYEDSILPYIDTAKLVYKDLMSISNSNSSVEMEIKTNDSDNIAKKDSDSDSGNCANGSEATSKLIVNSVVIKVSSVKNDNYTLDDLLFTRRHINNFFYIIIQPEDQTVYTLYHHVV